MKKLLFSLLITVTVIISHSLDAQITPLQKGHAHNDYIHARPLFEALENGFTGIEIDVYLYHNELKVAHLATGLAKKKTIEQLYFDPVKKRIEQNGGTVYKDQNTPVIFMIDFKTSGNETYLKLKEVLYRYQNIISVYKNDSVIHQRAINILISGRSPISELLKEDTALATIDEDISSMNKILEQRVTTRYSSGWENYFVWKGGGSMPVAQKRKLDSLVDQAHTLHKHIRFYHIPDKPNVWRTLLNAGVDWINTNKLKEYRRFYGDWKIKH